MPYDKFHPDAKISPKKFTANAPQQKVDDFKTLLKLSPIGPETYENTARTDGQYGVTRPWLQNAKETWLNKYDWRKTEEYINSFNNYITPIKSRDGDDYDIHFVTLLSDKKDAIPFCLMHGWPGSFYEFLRYLDHVKEKYSAADMPYSFIVPSLPGYGYSGGPSKTKEWTNEDMAFMMNSLMEGLGYSSGYIAHGGDIGSFLSRIVAVRYDACKAIHLNFNLMPAEPEGIDPNDVSDLEKKALQNLFTFATYGNAYAKEHGTKGGTIGLVLSSSPIALLCWIGEKFIEWSDTTPPLNEILDSVTLYWMTDTFPRSVYPYIDFFGRGDKSTVFHENPDYYCKKPIGYSYFPHELGPIPVAWVKKTGNLVHVNQHDFGGHFAAMEHPKQLFADQEEFVKKLNWK